MLTLNLAVSANKCGVKTLKWIYPHTTFTNEGLSKWVNAFQVSELLFSVVSGFVTNVKQKLFLVHLLYFVSFFQVEIYILFKYISLWNQVSLDGELIWHTPPHPPTWFFCVLYHWVSTAVLKFQGFDYSVPSVLAPSFKQGQFGDSHLCVPLFEILEFLCKGHFDSKRKLLNKSVIMEILEVHLLRYNRKGQTCLLGVEKFCFLPIGIHIYLWVFIIRPACCFFEFLLSYNLPLGAEWLFPIIILSYSKFSVERR